MPRLFADSRRRLQRVPHRRLGFEALEQRLTLTTLPAGFVDSPVVTGLSNPTSMVEAPDGRLFISQQGGQLRIARQGNLLPTPFLSLNVDSAGERGLLGVELDPNFASNQFVYVYYTVPGASSHNRLSRFVASGDVALAGSETVLLELDPLSTATNHNGGAIHFGNDGKLYIGVGENANGANAQTLGNLLGKVLRINADGSIPTDNPFFNSAVGKNRAIWAFGLRNPFTFAVHPGSGRIFINDVGQATWEEIDDGLAGANYGWPTSEGPTSNPAFVSPLFAYTHGAGNTQGFSIAGGDFYLPAVQQFPAEYVGDYFFADFVNGWIRRLDPAAGNAVSDFATNVGFGLVDVDTSADGSLLYLSRGGSAASGVVRRIEFPTNQPPLVVGADSGHAPTVRVLEGSSGLPRFDIQAFNPGFQGGVRVATGDVNGDGTYDIVAAAGPGGGPHVRVFDGRTGQQLPGPIGSFFAFTPLFTGGVQIAAGDFNRDGRADIIAAADSGGGPHVRIISGLDGSELASYYAYDAGFTGGVRIAAGDVDGNGIVDLITGAGPGGGPHVKVFSGTSASLLPGPIGSFFAYNSFFRGGVYVAAADFSGDGKADVLTGAGQGGGPHVRVFDAVTGAERTGFFAFAADFTGGVRVSAGDVNGDGQHDLIVAAGPGGTPQLRALRNTNLTELASLVPYETAFRGGTFVAGGLRRDSLGVLLPIQTGSQRLQRELAARALTETDDWFPAEGQPPNQFDD
jgi:glucose/arabinose dehydrogenase